MPQVPVYGGGAPTVGLEIAPAARPSGLGVPDTSGLQRGIENVSNVLGDVAQDLMARATDARAKELDIETADAFRSILNDPDKGYFAKQGRNAIDAYEPTRAELQKAIKSRADTLQDGALKQAYLEVANRRLESALNSVDGYALKANQDWQNQTSEARISAARNDAVANFTDPKQVSLQVNTGIAELDDLAERNGWAPEFLAEKKRAFESGTLTAIVSRMATDSYSNAAAYFEANKGRMTATDAVSADAVIRQAKAEREAKAAESREAFASDFLIGLRRGEKNYTDIEEAYSSGFLTGSQRATMTIYLDDKVAKDEERAAQLMRVDLAGNGGPPLDPSNSEDRKAVDQHFFAVTQNWTGMNGREVTDRAVDYAAQKGIVPSPLMSNIVGSLRAGTPAQQVEAAQTLSKLREANPELIKDFSKEDISRGNLIATYVDYGASPEKAVEMVTEAMKFDANVRKEREREYTEAQRGVFGEVSNDDYLVDAFATGGILGFFKSEPSVAAEIRTAFDVLAREEYVKHGNFESARKTALDYVNSTWGVTGVGGESRIMKWAPEKYYGVTGLSASENSEWMEQQLQKEVTSGTLGGVETPQLFESDVSERLILSPGGTFSDGRPYYSVTLMGTDGLPRLMTNSRGEPLRWFPDWEASDKAAEMKAEREEMVEDARAARERLLEGKNSFGATGSTARGRKPKMPEIR